MSGVEKRTAIRVDRRNKSRRQIFVAGSAVSVQGSKSVIVEDLSAEGAKLRGRDLPAVGKQVLIWMEGLDVLGSVAWSRFDERGVMFDSPLDPRALTCIEEQAVGTRFSFC